MARPALVGKIEVAVGSEEEIVDALEAFGIAPLDHWPRRAGLQIEFENAVAIVRDEGAAVAMDFKAVRLAVYSVTRFQPPPGETRKMRPNGISVT